MLKQSRMVGIGIGLLLVLVMAFPAFAQEVTPSVTVGDQPLTAAPLVVEQVVSNGPGWIVIHAQADGSPGPILGYTAVSDGVNNNVLVEIDASGATETLYAMLHTDAGEIGTFEFPNGPDTPVSVDGQVVTPSFRITVGVVVADQPIANDSVTVAKVFSDGTGWIVIHAQADGSPGPILGYTAVADGENDNVAVAIDTAAATATLYAMLHIDAGEIGTFEFPNGPDTPAMAGDQIVSPSFAVTGGLPATLPQTGAPSAPWFLVLMAAGGLLLSGALVLNRQRR
jgi:LPXTG-motif cell wall-anchored protein